MLELKLDESALRPLIRVVIAEVLSEFERLRKPNQERLVYTEGEAANMLGLRQHQLRDVRREGKIGHTRIVGGRIRYTVADLMAYLTLQRQEAED